MVHSLLFEFRCWQPQSVFAAAIQSFATLPCPGLTARERAV
jgi:hypothetical protein